MAVRIDEHSRVAAPEAGRGLWAPQERRNPPPRLEEDDVVLRPRVRVPAEPLVEPPRPLQIRHAERDQANALLHRNSLANAAEPGFARLRSGTLSEEDKCRPKSSWSPRSGDRTSGGDALERT